MRESKEELKKRVLENLISKPKSITQISRELHKERADVSRVISEMKGLVDTKEEVKKNFRGKCKVCKLKKKAYRFLGIPQPKKSLQIDSKKSHKTQTYLNDDSLCEGEELW